MHNRIGTPQAEFRQTYALNPNGRVVVQNLYGDVDITAWDRDEVLVQAIKQSTRSAPAERCPDRGGFVGRPGLDPHPVCRRGCGASGQRGVPHHGAARREPGECQADQRRAFDQRRGRPGKGVVGQRQHQGGALAGQADLSTVNGRLEAGFERVSRCNSISLSSVNGPIQLSIPSGAGAAGRGAEPERRNRIRFRTSLARVRRPSAEGAGEPRRRGRFA